MVNKYRPQITRITQITQRKACAEEFYPNKIQNTNLPAGRQVNTDDTTATAVVWH
jgi:hypothetical protein